MRINFIDVDGTLCPSIFNNDRLKNDNKNCLSDDFLKDLASVTPFGWCSRWISRHTGAGRFVNIIVTGRLPQHEELTKTWCNKRLYMSVHGFVSVPWDDTKATREESYKDYVDKKSWKLCNLIMGWLSTLESSNIPHEFHVYEDDTNVLHDMLEHLQSRYIGDYYPESNIHTHVVDARGEVHDYP